MKILRSTQLYNPNHDHVLQCIYLKPRHCFAQNINMKKFGMFVINLVSQAQSFSFHAYYPFYHPRIKHKTRV